MYVKFEEDFCGDVIGMIEFVMVVYVDFWVV